MKEQNRKQSELGKIYCLSDFMSAYEYISPGVWKNLEDNKAYKTSFNNLRLVRIDGIYLGYDVD